MTVLEAGFFYCPYIPLQIIEPMAREEYLRDRRKHLMRCPSAPFSCTGHCQTEEFRQEVEAILAKEKYIDTTLRGGQRVSAIINFKTRYASTNIISQS